MPEQEANELVEKWYYSGSPEGVFTTQNPYYMKEYIETDGANYNKNPIGKKSAYVQALEDNANKPIDYSTPDFDNIDYLYDLNQEVIPNPVTRIEDLVEPQMPPKSKTKAQMADTWVQANSYRNGETFSEMRDKGFLRNVFLDPYNNHQIYYFNKIQKGRQYPLYVDVVEDENGNKRIGYRDFETDVFRVER